MAVHELFPYLCVRNVPAALEFYRLAFDATELFRLTEPGGRIGHAEFKIGAFVVMLSEEFPEHGILAPKPDEKLPFVLHMHVDDADETMRRAVDAGATVVRPAADQFYGERSGRVRDPFGHEWMIGHSIEAVSTDEMQRRYTARSQ
jgi:uncharacterized glyoxalase superfamily protein PhnB